MYYIPKNDIVQNSNLKIKTSTSSSMSVLFSYKFIGGLLLCQQTDSTTSMKFTLRKVLSTASVAPYKRKIQGFEQQCTHCLYTIKGPQSLLYQESLV